MLPLDFNIFQKKLNEDQIVNHYPTVHCITDIDRFIFIMKSKEKWDYYTIVMYDTIREFAGEEDINQAFDMFITNYCANTLPVKPVERDVIIADIDDITKGHGQNSQSCKDALGVKQSPKKFRHSFSTPTTMPGFNKDSTIDAGEDVIDEAKDYSDFLLKFFNLMEKRVLSAVNEIEIDKMIINNQIKIDKSFINKTFGEFLRNLFNSVNTVAFATVVRRYIKADLIAGLVSAEAELGVDIGFTEAYKDHLNVLASQQIDGYMINGKKWPGIKGVTKEIQADVIKTVQEGINQKIGIDGIKKNISDRFEVFSDWRSEMISRTETNRILNEGKILGYKESGIPGKKVWDTAIDNRTSPICLRLNDQLRELDEDFIDPETRKAFGSPPAHPNCRSVVRFIAK